MVVVSHDSSFILEVHEQHWWIVVIDVPLALWEQSMHLLLI